MNRPVWIVWVEGVIDSVKGSPEAADARKRELEAKGFKLVVVEEWKVEI